MTSGDLSVVVGSRQTLGKVDDNNDFASWTRLRTIGNTTVAKASIFLPAFPYIIDTLDKTLDLGVSASDNQLQTRLIYLGLCLVAAASLTFFIACPATIKRYQDDIDFVDAEMKYLTDVRREYFEIQADSLGWLGHAVNVRSEDLLFAVYSGKNFSRPFARRLCAMLYLISFFLLLIPFLSRFLKAAANLFVA